MKKVLISAALIALVSSAFGQDTATRVTSEQLTWKENPVIPKGAFSAVLVGDPTKTSVVVVHNKFPANYKVPAHTHPYAEVVTVLSGSVGFGLGDTFDTSKGEVLKAGGVNTVPAKQPHFAWTGNEEAIIQVQYIGPGGIDYINPADDPRKKSN